MTVVAYPHIQPQGPGPWVEIEQRSATAVFRSPTVGTVRTLDRVGSVWAFTVRYQGLTMANAARLSAFLSACRGQGSRFYLPVWSHDQRGSGFGSELFSNGTFASGTTGWSVSSIGVLSAPDYLARMTMFAVDGVNFPAMFQSVNPANNIPHVIRSVLHDGLGTAGLSAGAFIDGTVVTANGYSTSRGLSVASLVSGSAGAAAQVPIAIGTASGYKAGDFIECSFASMSRCALVDNGPNILLQSDEFDATWTTAQATIDDQALASPDGVSTADYLAEDGTAATVHYVNQGVTVASSAADYSFGVFVKAANRSWVLLEMVESTGSHTADAYFNVGAGAVGNLSVSGGNWVYPRGYIVDCGNGWYYCCVVARKASAGTTISSRVYAAEANGDAVFSGLTQNSLGLWRATLAQSSVPTRPIATTTTAAAAGTSQTGGALHLKGLPASTSGILLRGDWVQIMQPNGSQLVKVTSALNSDAAGLGYLEFEPMLRESPADNAPVIATNPLARCLLDHNSVRWARLADNCVDLEFTAIEDIVPV